MEEEEGAWSTPRGEFPALPERVKRSGDAFPLGRSGRPMTIREIVEAEEPTPTPAIPLAAATAAEESQYAARLRRECQHRWVTEVEIGRDGHARLKIPAQDDDGYILDPSDVFCATCGQRANEVA